MALPTVVAASPLVAASMTAASSPAAATTAPTPGFLLAVVEPMAGRSRTRMTTTTKLLRGAATTTTTSGAQAMTTTGHGDVATPATAATLPLPPSPWSSTTWICSRRYLHPELRHRRPPPHPHSPRRHGFVPAATSLCSISSCRTGDSPRTRTVLVERLVASFYLFVC